MTTSNDQIKTDSSAGEEIVELQPKSGAANDASAAIKEADPAMDAAMDAAVSEARARGNKIENIKPAKNVVQEQFSAVAVSSDHKKILVIVGAALVAGLSYLLFFSSSPAPDSQKEDPKKVAADRADIVRKSVSVPKIESANREDVARTVKIPEPLPISDPVVPASPPIPIPLTPPVPAPVLPAPVLPNIAKNAVSGMGNTSIKEYNSSVTNPFNASNEERKKRLEMRRKAGIMVAGGGFGSAKGENDKDADGQDKLPVKKDNSGFLGFGNGALDGGRLSKTSAPQVVATRVGDLDRTILQGKIINAILETAINTDIPGALRGIISRDVYSESGKNILIPKGSRLIGSYQASVKPGQTRLNVLWHRLIRPDGIDIAIDSAGTDQLGRAGVMGYLDNKFFVQLANAFLISYIPVLLQGKGDVSKTVFNGMGSLNPNQTQNQVVPPQQSASQISDPTNPQSSIQHSQGSLQFSGSLANVGNSVTVTGSARDVARQEAAAQFSKLASETIKNNSSVTPTITIDQGTIVNIIVQKDLVFPSGAIVNNTIIQ